MRVEKRQVIMRIANRAFLFAWMVALSACTSHWNSYRYQSEKAGYEISGADFRLVVGWSWVKHARDDESRNDILRELLLKEVESRGDCQNGQVDNFLYGSYEGGGTYSVAASCSR